MVEWWYQPWMNINTVFDIQSHLDLANVAEMIKIEPHYSGSHLDYEDIMFKLVFLSAIFRHTKAGIITTQSFNSIGLVISQAYIKRWWYVMVQVKAKRINCCMSTFKCRGVQIPKFLTCHWASNFTNATCPAWFSTCTGE